MASTKTHKPSPGKESSSQKRRVKKQSSHGFRKSAEKHAASAKPSKTVEDTAVKPEGSPAANPEAPPPAPVTVGNSSTPPTDDPMVVTMDRRRLPDRRSGVDRRQQNIPVAVERRQLERRAKVPRRRQIDPTTCERDYTPEEIEFMKALDEYKRSSGRMFPTCSEILEVLKKLGYEKRPQPAAQPAATGSRFDPDENTPAVEAPPPSAAPNPSPGSTAEGPREGPAPATLDPGGSDSSL